MKAEILKILKDSDGFVSGQMLCARFGVSRTAVWKVMAQLREEGYEIVSVPHKGYRLSGLADVLSEHELASSRNTAWIGERLVFFSETDSTNNQAKRLAEEGAENGTLLVADCQTSGRGRRGRSFDSPAHTGIFMTLLLRPPVSANNASRLTLLAAMAVQRAIEETTGVKALIKWPNDIILSGKKVCGILTEMSAEEGEVSYVVIGIGVNVGAASFPEEIRDVATSIFLETGKKPRRTELIWGVWQAFEELYAAYLPTQDLREVMEDYNRLLINCGKKVEVLDPAGAFCGTAQGINEKGELLVDTEQGLLTVSSGEVSVRGVYGYV